MLKIYCNGLTLSFPKKSQGGGGTRNKTTGWSDASTRSNTQFLYSVDTSKLTGAGYAFTFTIRDLPPTPKEWREIRKRFMQRCNRMGLIRAHWVTEWQRRGVPHLHGCLYFPEPLHQNDLRKIVSHWRKSAAKYEANHKGQMIMKIDSAVGWLQYLSKHNSRSKTHYQRSSKPAEWDSSGRVWGKSGDWPTKLTEHATHGYKLYAARRIIRRWRIADARQLTHFEMNGEKIYPDSYLYKTLFPDGFRNARRISQARRCLKCNDRAFSYVKGMSEWIPEKLAFQMIGYIESL